MSVERNTLSPWQLTEMLFQFSHCDLHVSSPPRQLTETLFLEKNGAGASERARKEGAYEGRGGERDTQRERGRERERESGRGRERGAATCSLGCDASLLRPAQYQLAAAPVPAPAVSVPVSASTVQYPDSDSTP
eukprot:3115165-Rhodomonas_salina.1